MSECQPTDESRTDDRDSDLQPNWFSLDLDEDDYSELVEESLQSAEDEFRERSTGCLSDYEGRLSDEVAAQWGTPTGDWWP